MSNFIKFRAFAPSRLRALSYSFAQKIFSRVSHGCKLLLRTACPVHKHFRVCAFAPVSHNSTHKTFSSSPLKRQGSFCALTKFQSFRGLFAILAAAFLLAACESPDSSPGPSKEQAVKQLQTATENLQNAIEKEVKARTEYVRVGGKKTAMLRLLRRIAVLGLTQDEAYATWIAAKNVVTTRQGEVTAAIATLRGAGGGVEADKAKESIDKVMRAVAKVRSLKTLSEVKAAGEDAEKFMAEAVSAVSNLLSSGGLVYSVGNGRNYKEPDSHKNFDWYVITESGNTQTFPLEKVREILGEKTIFVAGLKDYWLLTSGGKVSLLRRSDGETISVANSNLTGNIEDFTFVYRDPYVYYDDGFKIYRFKVSTKPTVEPPLYKSAMAFFSQFALDKNSNMLLNVSGKGLQFFEAQANGTIAKPIPVKIDDQTITSEANILDLISGPTGKTYVLQKKQTKVQLYAVEKKKNGEQFVSTTKEGGEVEIGNNSLGHPMKTDNAIFFALVKYSDDAPDVIQNKFLRFTGGALGLVEFPSNKEIILSNNRVVLFSVVQTSKYLYAAFKAGGKGGLYRVGDADGFSKVNIRPLPNNDVPNLYAISSEKPGLKGEIAFAAEDKGDHWIIERKPDGTGRRIKARGKVAQLVYLNF